MRAPEGREESSQGRAQGAERERSADARPLGRAAKNFIAPRRGAGNGVAILRGPRAPPGRDIFLNALPRGGAPRLRLGAYPWLPSLRPCGALLLVALTLHSSLSLLTPHSSFVESHFLFAFSIAFSLGLRPPGRTKTW